MAPPATAFASGAKRVGSWLSSKAAPQVASYLDDVGKWVQGFQKAAPKIGVAADVAKLGKQSVGWIPGAAKTAWGAGKAAVNPGGRILTVPLAGAAAAGTYGGLSSGGGATPGEEEQLQTFNANQLGVMAGAGLFGGLSGMHLAKFLGGSPVRSGLAGLVGAGLLGAHAWNKSSKYNPLLAQNMYYGGPAYNPNLQGGGVINSLMQTRIPQFLQYGHRNW